MLCANRRVAMQGGPGAAHFYIYTTDIGTTIYLPECQYAIKPSVISNVLPFCACLPAC